MMVDRVKRPGRAKPVLRAVPATAPPAVQSVAEQMAAKQNMPVEVVERILAPWTAEQKAEAYSALKDQQHALALDPDLSKHLSERVGVAGTGMALHLQMQDIAPKDEIERMIALQLIAMNGLTLRATRAAHKTERIDHYRDYANVASKSSRTFATLLEALNRHRGKSSEQKVTVEHVHVYEGGQAIVGNVETPVGQGRGRRKIGTTTP